MNTKLNTVLSFEIGNAVFIKSEVVIKNAIKLEETFMVKSGFVKFNYTTGSVYPLQFSKNKFELYFLKSNLRDRRHWGIVVSPDNSSELSCPNQYGKNSKNYQKATA